jgi:DnaK suppressor protein
MSVSQAVLETIKKQLTEERSHIQTNLDSLHQQDPYSDPDRLVDNAASDTEANEESSHERVEALEKELRMHIEEINNTLSRIEKGTYGNCISCGKPIEIERLKITPTASTCMICQRKHTKE